MLFIVGGNGSHAGANAIHHLVRHMRTGEAVKENKRGETGCRCRKLKL